MRRRLIVVCTVAILIIGCFGLVRWRAAMADRPDLTGKRVAFLLVDQFNPDEYARPRAYLVKCGAETVDVGLALGDVDAWHTDVMYKVDLTLADITAGEIDCLVIPGGQGHPALIADERVGKLIRELADSGKVVAANGRSPLVLGEAGVLTGRSVTVWPDVAIQLREFAGSVSDSTPVVVDGNIVTSRGPNNARDFGVAIAQALLGRR